MSTTPIVSALSKPIVFGSCLLLLAGLSAAQQRDAAESVQNCQTGTRNHQHKIVLAAIERIEASNFEHYLKLSQAIRASSGLSDSKAEAEMDQTIAGLSAANLMREEAVNRYRESHVEIDEICAKISAIEFRVTILNILITAFAAIYGFWVGLKSSSRSHEPSEVGVDSR